MRVNIDMDAKTLWAISATAEKLGVSNSDVLEMRLSGLRRQSMPERVRELHARGFSDADMAEETGYVVGSIATIRRRLGLKPNRRYRGAA